MRQEGLQNAEYRRRATAALLDAVVVFLATCLLWFTGIEAGAFHALQIGGIAHAASCGIAAALYARKSGRPRFATIAIVGVIALIAASIAFLLLLIEFASRFE